MVEAGHFAEMDNILRLTIRKSQCVLYHPDNNWKIDVLHPEKMKSNPPNLRATPSMKFQRKL